MIGRALGREVRMSCRVSAQPRWTASLRILHVKRIMRDQREGLGSWVGRLGKQILLFSYFCQDPLMFGMLGAGLRVPEPGTSTDTGPHLRRVIDLVMGTP